MDTDQFNEREIAERRDATLLRMLKTPPKRNSEMKLGKPRRKKKKSPERSKAK